MTPSSPGRGQATPVADLPALVLSFPSIQKASVGTGENADCACAESSWTILWLTGLVLRSRVTAAEDTAVEGPFPSSQRQAGEV